MTERFDGKGLHRLRIVSDDGTARGTHVLLDGEPLRGVLAFTLRADANGVGPDRFVRLELAMLVREAEVDGPLSLLVDVETLRERLDRTREPEPVDPSESMVPPFVIPPRDAVA